MIFVNFKTYAEATGENAIILAKICQKAQEKTGSAIRVCVQTADIFPVSQNVGIPVWAQHIDPVEPEKSTGFTTALDVRQNGASGVLLNHSEHPLNFEDLEKAIHLAQEAELETLVFVKDIDMAKRVDELSPEFMALEDPKLIGSGQAMVERPEDLAEIRKFFNSGFGSILLIGAGISAKEDIRKSLEIGAKGVVLSSAVVLADDPCEKLEELTKGFK